MVSKKFEIKHGCSLLKIMSITPKLLYLYTCNFTHRFVPLIFTFDYNLDEIDRADS